MNRWAQTLTLLALVACSGGEPAKDGKPAADPNADKGKWETHDTLIIAVQADIGSLIPVKPRTQSDNFIMDNLAVSPIDGEFDCSLKKRPGLAKTWEWSEDGKKVTLHLDPSYTWEDGHPVTADDLKFSYELAGNPAVASQRIDFLKYMKEGANPRVVDDHTVEFEFTRAYDRDTQAAHVSLLPMPRHILGDVDPTTLEGHPFAKKPLVYGPWRLAKHVPNQMIILEPNWNFTGPEERRPKLSRVIYKIIPEYSARVIALEKGDVDMIEQVEIADADRLGKLPDIDIIDRGLRAMDYVAWNPAVYPPFADLKVRTALAHGVDVDRIMGKILKGEDGSIHGRRAVGTITPELCGAVPSDEEVGLVQYDPEKAKALLAEAGWTDTDGDGFVDKDGKKFAFTMVTNQGNKRRADATIEIQADLKKIGVDMSVDTKESNTFFEKVEAREYEAFLAGWSAGLFIDPSNMWGSDPPGQKKAHNHTSYSNPEVDALIERGMNTPDPREAAPIWTEMQKKIYADQPYLFLWWFNASVPIAHRIEGEKINLLSNYNDMHEWHVAPDKVKYKDR